VNRIRQLIKEAIEEIEVYNSWLSSYYLLKYIESEAEKLCKIGEINYDVTLDSLIFFTIYLNGKSIDKTRLFSLSFLVYDLLSNKGFKVQDPLFQIRWNKRYFIFSPRINDHLEVIRKKGLVLKKNEYYLTDISFREALGIYDKLSSRDKNDLQDLVKKFKSLRKVKDIKTFIRNYLAGRSI